MTPNEMSHFKTGFKNVKDSKFNKVENINYQKHSYKDDCRNMYIYTMSW